MKNNLSSRMHQPFMLLAACFIGCCGYSQVVTGTISTEIFHTTSATSNATVTYSINLSNGWQDKISTVTSLTFLNAALTPVYTHSDIYANYGTVTPVLPPGYYKITANVSTKDNLGSWVSVALSKEIWVGYKAQWAKCLDLSEGMNQYALKRSNMSTGITRAYAQSYNTLAASTAGWIEMNAPVTTTAGSSVVYVLEPLANPATFALTDNITYVEYFYTNSTTKGIRVKARNASNVYAITTLSGVGLGDKLRFERDASGNSKLWFNGTATVAHSFAKALTAAVQVNVLAALSTDVATGIACSFGYPTTTLPLMTSFSDSKSTGDVSIRIEPLTGFVAPYHYLVSPNPIPELKTVYKNLKDSIFGGTLDSTSFFMGPVNSTSYTYREVPMGPCYFSAFDSRGVRIYSNTYSVLPAVDLTEVSNVTVAYNEYLSRAPLSYASTNLYMNEGADGAVTFSISEITAEHSFGMVIASDAVGSGGDTYSKIEAGFCVKNGLLYTVEKGILSTTTVTAKKDVPIDIIKTDGQLKLFTEGALLKTITLPATFQYKVGMYFKSWGTKLLTKPLPLSKVPFTVTHVISNNSCSATSVDLTFNHPAIGSAAYFGGTIRTGTTFQLNNLATSTIVAPTSTTTGSKTYTSLAPGLYTITGNVYIGTTNPGTLYPFTQYIYAGYATAWENEANIYSQSGQPATLRPHAIGSSTVNPVTAVYGQAIGSGKLAPSTAGWMVFKPVPFSGSNWMNVLALSESPQFNMLGSTAVNMPALFFASSGGILYINNPVSQTLSSVHYSPGIPIVAQRDATGAFKLTQNGALLTNSSISGYFFGRWKPSVLIKKSSSGFSNILSNFPCTAAANAYAHLKYELDGYYHVMNNCRINFVYNEEYNASALKFTIYTDNMTKVYDQANFAVVPIAHGENRISLFVGDTPHCLSGSRTFILEVVNEKKEHFYLRFYNKSCSTCTIPGQDPNDPSN